MAGNRQEAHGEVPRTTVLVGSSACFGIIPERIDLFERDAARASTGGGGYIDLFWSGVVLGEAKSLGADLTKAFDQALDYLAGGSIGQHKWPKFTLVADFEYLRLPQSEEGSWTHVHYR